MPKIPFNVDAYTARLIGRENVSKLNGAILELVKNTYDADASVCFVYFDESRQEVYIGDNGCGMTPEIIRTNWMTIGRSSKKARYVSQAGRVQTGAKGIGRFALDRIADQCTMLTMTSSDGGFIWKVDWRDFEQEHEITNVSAELYPDDISFSSFTAEIQNSALRALIRENFDGQGTIFKLSTLRDNWNAEKIDELKKDLNSLIPYEMSNSFNIYLFDNTVSLEEATVLHDNEAFSYDYKLSFEVDDAGRTLIQIWRNEFDFHDQFESVMKKADFKPRDREYFMGKPIEYVSTLSEILFREKDKIANPIGSFSGTLYFAKLAITPKDKKVFFYKDITGRKDFRKTFGGIKIYRDQFRVRPYGDANSSNYDWLQLAVRQSGSPAAVSAEGAWRVRANQMLGSVFISRTNITLPDQANREGIVETSEFRLLKSFLCDAIQLFEKDRQYVCRKLAELYKKESRSEQLEQEIAEKAKRQDVKSKSTSSSQSWEYAADSVSAKDAQTVIDDKDAAIRNLADENRLLRVLATTGIATNSCMHEFKAKTHGLSMHIVTAKEALEFGNNPQSALTHLIEANQIRESFNSWFRVTIESVRRDKRTQRTINLNEYLHFLCEAWQIVIEENDISIEFQEPEKQIEFRCFPYEFDLIISNLVTNSVAAFATQSEPGKKIIVRLAEDEASIFIEYFDNGPGLPSAYKMNPDQILEPHETSKKNEQGESVGTGMGMWLIKRTVLEYTGTIDLLRNTTEGSGFFIRILMPK